MRVAGAMQAALAGAQLASATSDAPPLPNAVAALLRCSQSPHESSGEDLPSFSDLAEALDVPCSCTAQPPAKSRLPMRIVARDGGATQLERSLWRTYEEGGMHELLSREMVAALASRIRGALARVVLHDLGGRDDLNGQRAEVVGPLTDGGRVPVRVLATGECVRARPRNVFDGCDDDELPCVLEAGAGSGALAFHLSLALAGYARVVACDDLSAFGRKHTKATMAAAAAATVGSAEPGAEAIGGAAEVVQRMGCEEALSRFSPRVVLAAWHSSGADWTAAFRECASVVAYLLLGEKDSSTCGDAWATWGVLPDNYYEYGLDEDSPAPHAAEGFERVECEEVLRWQICRFDSAAARGFSSTVAFVRKEAVAAHLAPDWSNALAGAEETLEESWERMQRSVASGKAQRMPVEMDMQVTDG